MCRNLKYILLFVLSFALIQCGEDSDPKKLLPTLSINDAAAEEGMYATFTVTLSKESTEIVTVSYTTSNGTATSSDFKTVTTARQIMFAPGVTTAEIAIGVYQDKDEETSETFKVTLSDPVNAELSEDVVGTGTINNGPAPYFMTMKVDGVLWTATQTFFFEPSYTPGFMAMSGYGTGVFDDSQISFNFNKNPEGPTVYEPQGDGADADTKVRVYWDPHFFSSNGFGELFIGQPGGEVKFTKFDMTKMEAEGTFHMTVKSEDDGEEIEITEGEFRMKISDF